MRVRPKNFDRPLFLAISKDYFIICDLCVINPPVLFRSTVERNKRNSLIIEKYLAVNDIFCIFAAGYFYYL